MPGRNLSLRKYTVSRGSYRPHRQSSIYFLKIIYSTFTDIREREKQLLTSSLIVQSIAFGLPMTVPLLASAFTFISMTATGYNLSATQVGLTTMPDVWLLTYKGTDSLNLLMLLVFQADKFVSISNFHFLITLSFLFRHLFSFHCSIHFFTHLDWFHSVWRHWLRDAMLAAG